MDVEQLVRDNFADRAAAVGRPPAGLHEDVLAGYRQQRRTRGLLAVGALVVALLVAGVPWLRGHGDGGVAGPTAPSSGPSGSAALLYDVPTRGSLAGDTAELTAIRQLTWDTGAPSDPGPPIEPDPDTRRVLFAGEVPGGQVWALVEGVVDGRYYFAWFADVVPADGLSFVLARGPVEDDGVRAVALLDESGDSGPLLVVALPGDRVVATTDPIGVLGGSGSSAEEELPTTDGVAGTVVETVDERVLHGVQVFDGDRLVAAPSPLQFSSAGLARPPGAPTPPADQYVPLMTACLGERGFAVTTGPDGRTLAYEASSVEERAAYAAAVHECASGLGYG